MPKETIPRGKGHDVICPECRERYYVTTSLYYPEKTANAGMYELKAIYKSYGWDEPVPDPTAGYGPLECVECKAPLAPSGYLIVKAVNGHPPAGPVEDPEDKEPEAKSPDTVDGQAELPPELSPGDPAQVKEGEPPNIALGKVVQKVEKEPDHVVVPSEDKLPSVITDAGGEIKQWICPECHREDFKTRQALNAHSRVHKSK